MTREEVIQLAFKAKVAWPKTHDLTSTLNAFNEDHINACVEFAALIAAHERDECAKICEELKNNLNHASKEWSHADLWDVAEACAMRIRLREK